MDDIAFLTALIEQLQVDHRIDPARVYVAGVSAGAMMAYRLACEAADRVGWVGSLAGAMVLDQCRPSRPVPVIEIYGTDDAWCPTRGAWCNPKALPPSPHRPRRRSSSIGPP
ncbi:MAG: alpha/beta hydrolase fold domain-containing protein [Actinomycetota bacterium]|nr:alpha/beta hydrolase fold domain-containing protein [Actinomycetota bacterium]